MNAGWDVCGPRIDDVCGPNLGDAVVVVLLLVAVLAEGVTALNPAMVVVNGSELALPPRPGMSIAGPGVAGARETFACSHSVGFC